MLLVGLLLLAVLAVLTFFGFSERFFRKIGIPDWLAFLLILAFVIGAVVPVIPIGTRVTLHVGGFLVPASLFVILLIVSPVKKEKLRTLLAVFAVAGISVAARMLLRPNSEGLYFVLSVVTGLACGIAAYLAGRTRAATLAGALGGVVLGDIINNIILRFVYGAPIAFGSFGVFDSVVLAAVVGIVLLEAVQAIKRTMHQKRVSKRVLQAEFAEDTLLKDASVEKENEKIDKELNNFFNEE
ncbi:MAG: hypothetical protein FWH03_06925 [Firmicutes bacterium]|nr:hypothetical protein [Bacillota bacterium]